MRVLRAADQRHMRWKNGAGETREIAAHPPGAALDEFDWRVSMARVEADGPFSMFPGVERTLAILSGAGLDLDVEGHGQRRLTEGSPPFSFAADVATSARLVHGPITDLNVMSRRGTVRHEVVRLQAAPGEPQPLSPQSWDLLVAAGACHVVAGGSSIDLMPGEALHRTGADGSLAFGAAGPAASTYLVRFIR